MFRSGSHREQCHDQAHAHERRHPRRHGPLDRARDAFRRRCVGDHLPPGLPYHAGHARWRRVTYDKAGFIAHFRKQAEEGGTPLNPWADWHDFHVLDDSAVCVLTRKHSGMTGEEMMLLCNIEWRFEDDRWQVLREQIFLRPPDS